MKKYIYTFGSQKHANKLAQVIDSKRFALVHILDEYPDKPGSAKSAEEIVKLFEQYYKTTQDIAAFINFGRGTVIGGLEGIARSWEIIRKKYPDTVSAKSIGPSYNAAKIFSDKALTHSYLEVMGVSTPRTKLLVKGGAKQNRLILKKEGFPFPAVIKATHLSGGQGMKLIPSLKNFDVVYDELRTDKSYGLMLSEFMEGPEASFALLRLGDIFLRIPPSYKDKTTPELKHSDRKVKMAGIFKEFEPIYQYLETIMWKENISGLLYLQAILQKNPEGEYTCKVIEGETRLTGSSPISFGALKGFNFYKVLATWIDSGEVAFSYENQLCIQYASYIHHGESDIVKLLARDWIIEAKYEKDLAASIIASKPIMRIRVSFVGEDSAKLAVRLKQIGDILDNPHYKREVQSVLDFYRKAHPSLFYEPQKLLEGRWNDNVRWEFYRSAYLPPRNLCAAVFVLAVVRGTPIKIVLTKTSRGWEMLGGHVDEGESIEDALVREAQEEGGFLPNQYKLFGYRKIIPQQPVPNRSGGYYPFPVSYIPHYVATTTLPITSPTGQEVEESALFTIAELQQTNMPSKDIAMIGFEAYKNL